MSLSDYELRVLAAMESDLAHLRTGPPRVRRIARLVVVIVPWAALAAILSLAAEAELPAPAGAAITGVVATVAAVAATTQLMWRHRSYRE